MRTSISVIALAFLLGCATFNDNAGKVLATVAKTVDTAMQGWAQYLKLHPLPPSKQMRVKSAYEKYQLSMAAAEKAYIELVKTGDRTAWQAAAAALTAAQADLLAAITAITGKAVK